MVKRYLCSLMSIFCSLFADGLKWLEVGVNLYV